MDRPLGCVDISAEPYKIGGEAYKIHEVFRPFIKLREDPAELLEFAIKVFDQAALFSRQTCHIHEAPSER